MTKLAGMRGCCASMRSALAVRFSARPSVPTGLGTPRVRPSALEPLRVCLWIGVSCESVSQCLSVCVTGADIA